MKKNDTKTIRNKPPEVRTREQAEDRAFNRMLIWLAATVVVEGLMLLVNRFYIHARVEELGAIPTLHSLLAVVPVVGIVLFAALLIWAMKIRKDESTEKDGFLQIVVGCSCLVAGVGAFGMRLYGVAGAPMVLGIVPALGVLMLVFYLYQKEFFGCALASGLAILGLWIFRSVGGGTTFYAYLVVALVIIVVGVALAMKLKKTDGLMTIQGKEVAVLQPGAAYPACLLTAVVSAVLLLSPLALGAAMAYYAIWVMAAWLFVLAVYFTSKLM